MSREFKIISSFALYAQLFFVPVFLSAANSEWSILVYMQADNNLSDFADKDMVEMVKAYQRVSIDPNFTVNTLTQVDYPRDKKTWRFKIDQSGKIEHDSLTQEMGMHPAEELVASAQWIKNKYPANHYAIILWNHGSGIEDYRSIEIDTIRKFSNKKFDSIWMDIFNTDVLKKGRTAKIAKKNVHQENSDERGLGISTKNGRGILYDDSENTCLTNQGLTFAFSKIRDIFGKKIDLVGMDACLMAMLEVAYEIKDYVGVLVASQETEPGYGWDYTGFLSPLLSSPGEFDAAILAKVIVSSYGFFYSPTNMQAFTQSAMDLSLLDPLCANINAVVMGIFECLKYKSSVVKTALRNARSNSKSFETVNYIDLFSFYFALHAEITKLRHDLESEKPSCFGFLCKPSPNYISALDKLIQDLNDGAGIIEHVVFANAVGTASEGAHGISIYYPRSASGIHPSYPNTLFAQHVPGWLNLIKQSV